VCLYDPPLQILNQLADFHETWYECNVIEGRPNIIIIYFLEPLVTTQENRDYGRGDPLRLPRDTLYQLKLALTSPTGGGLSVGIVRLRTKTTEFFFELSLVRPNKSIPFVQSHDYYSSEKFRRSVSEEALCSGKFGRTNYYNMTEGACLIHRYNYN
jgi:hypothetical protein